jgi:hypothetical protein
MVPAMKLRGWPWGAAPRPHAKLQLGYHFERPFSHLRAYCEQMQPPFSIYRCGYSRRDPLYGFAVVSRWFRGGFARFRAGFAAISRGFAPVSRVISRGFALVSRGFALVSRRFRGSITVVSRGFAGFREVSQAFAYIASHCISQGIAKYRGVSQGFTSSRTVLRSIKNNTEPWRRGIEAASRPPSRLRRGCVEAVSRLWRRGIEAYSRLTTCSPNVKASRMRRGYTSRLYVEAIRRASRL